MATKGRTFDILDGRKIRQLAEDEAALEAMLADAFDELDTDRSGSLSRAELRPAFLSMAKALGLPAPGSVAQLDDLIQVMFRRDEERSSSSGGGGGAGEARDLDRPGFTAAMKGILTDVAQMLQEDPLFVSVFNGVVLKELLEAPEALEAVITKAFETMDKDSNGRLSRAELLPVLKLLSGGEEGLPPPPVIEAMEAAIVKEFSLDGAEELSREEFDALFRELMQFLATSLEAEPVMFVQEATVLNGHALRKLVGDEAAMKKEADDLFREWDRSKRGQLSLGDVANGLQRMGMQIGLPPASKEAEGIYAALFAAADFDSSGFVDRAEFELLLRALLLSLAAQLEKSPVVVGTAVSSLESLVPGSRLMDGTDLLEALKDDEKISQVLRERFDALDVNKDGTLSKSELKPALLRLAQLLGLPPAGTQQQLDRLLDELFRAVVSDDPSEEVGKERFVAVSKEILQQIAACLEADPMVSAVLDGSPLQLLLGNPTEFEKLCTTMFESLDTDRSGQLSMAELKPALQELGLALGIPPAGVKAEGDAMVAAAVEEYGHGKRELTKDEFATLLRDILSDIALRLSASPIVVGQSVKVLNGSRIRKLLANPEEFQTTAQAFFVEWDTTGTGRLSKADLIAGMKKLGMALGLPPPKARDADRVYNHLFASADMDDSGFVDAHEFRDFLVLVFVQIASELEKNPVVIEATIMAYT